MFHKASFGADELLLVKRAHRGHLILPGAFVRLNSGGPVGLVADLLRDGRARVSWLTDPPTSSVLPDRCLTPVS